MCVCVCGGGGGGGGGLYPPKPRIFNYIDFLTCMYIILVYLEVCTVFVVLDFRLYVTKFLCFRVKMARGLLKYNAAREKA